MVDELTPRELEVLTLIAGGLCNREFAGELSIVCCETTIGPQAHRKVGPFCCPK